MKNSGNIFLRNKKTNNKNMKSKINYFRYLGLDYDPLYLYQPEDISMFRLWLEVSVGVEGEEGEEVFQIFICSQKWLEKKIKEYTFFVGLHAIIMDEYNYDNLCRILNSLFCIEGSNYEEISNKLGQIALSEHQQYRDIGIPDYDSDNC